jgi:hypothetical protein
MPCDTCNSSGAAAKPAAAMIYSATASSVVGRDGVRHSIAKPLIPAGRKPTGGWKVNLLVNGQSIEADGPTGEAVHAEAVRLLQLNGITYSDLDLWLNLNLQWVRRAVEKYQVVRESDLMTAASGSAVAPEHAPTRARPQVGPAVWGRKGWGMLQMYLALDTYEFGTLLMLATELRKWLDPNVNPTTGCAECFIHFGAALADLRNRPRYTQAEAREWLWRVMNGANSRKGVPEMTFEQAALANHWT